MFFHPQPPMGNGRPQTLTAGADNKHTLTSRFCKHTRWSHFNPAMSLLSALLFLADSEQGIGGREAPMKATKPWNNRRFIGTFDVENTTKGDSGRYRCIVHSDKGVGVSNYGELTIKREYTQSEPRSFAGGGPKQTKPSLGLQGALGMTSACAAKSTGDKQETPLVRGWKRPPRRF